MGPVRAVVVSLLALAVVGCANPRKYFRLEEFGQGWKLEVKDKGTAILPKWVKGDHLSSKLLNYYEATAGGVYVINTLYLEIAADHKVVNGWLKRWSTPDFDRRAYFEGRAEWFRVLSGQCVLDAEGNGTVDVRCEGGYEFRGDVVPSEKMKVIKPE